MEDFVVPAELVPSEGETVTPDILARRSARHVKDMMPAVVRDVVVGSPLLTELVERGEGAAFIVHCVAEMSAGAAAKEIEKAATGSGWTQAPHLNCPEGAPKSSWTKQNLTMHFEAVQRPGLFECDVDYRFTDDEAYISKKGKTNED